MAKMKSLLALAAGFALSIAGQAQAQIVINEIESDTFNTPSTDYAEFIELYSLTGTTTPLDGLVLVLFNGGTNGPTSPDVSYRVIDLDGLSTDSRGFYVFGTPSVTAANDTTFLGPNGNVLQNGQDAVAIYTANATDFPAGTAPTMTNLVDAIVYGTEDVDDGPLLAALGETIQYNEGANPPSDAANFSLSRFVNGTGDFVLTTPTPGLVNVPEPSSTALLAFSAFMGLLRRRRTCAVV